MRFDILSNRSAAERAMREDLLKRQVKVKEERARAAVITAQTGARTGEQRFGPSGLVGEELERRYPRGLPGMEAETARISATGYAGAARRGAATAEKRLGLEREEFEWGKEFIGEAGGMPGSPEAEAGEVAKIRKRLSADICPEGFAWDGQQCIPME